MYIRDWSIRNARWPKNRCDILRVCPREDELYFQCDSLKINSVLGSLFDRIFFHLVMTFAKQW